VRYPEDADREVHGLPEVAEQQLRPAFGRLPLRQRLRDCDVRGDLSFGLEPLGDVLRPTDHPVRPAVTLLGDRKGGQEVAHDAVGPHDPVVERRKLAAAPQILYRSGDTISVVGVRD